MQHILSPYQTHNASSQSARHGCRSESGAAAAHRGHRCECVGGMHAASPWPALLALLTHETGIQTYHHHSACPNAHCSCTCAAGCPCCQRNRFPFSLLPLPSTPCGCQASSVKNNEDEYHPDNVTTDDRDETWHAGMTAPAHIDLDLGSSAMIEHLDLLPYQASSAQGNAHHGP